MKDILIGSCPACYATNEIQKNSEHTFAACWNCGQVHQITTMLDAEFDDDADWGVAELFTPEEGEETHEWTGHKNVHVEYHVSLNEVEVKMKVKDDRIEQLENGLKEIIEAAEDDPSLGYNRGILKIAKKALGVQNV